MSAIADQLDAYLLENPGNMDYWTDYAFQYGSSISRRLDSADVGDLGAVWRDRTADWQYRLAHILAYSDGDIVITLLITLIECASSEDVVVRATESLRELAKTAELGMISDQAVDRIARIANSHPGPVAHVLGLFLKSLPKQGR